MVASSHPVSYSDTCCYALFLLLVSWGVIFSEEMPLHTLLVWFICSFFAVIIIRVVFTRELQIHGYSMHPTLPPGCLISVVRFGWYSCFFSLNVGDVVSFLPDKDTKVIGGYDPNDDATFVKRIAWIDESGMLFVEGDARRASKHDSFDSNDFGLVPVSSVRGVWV